MTKPLGDPKKILIIRLKSLGDILNCIPAMRSIAEGYPSAKVDVLLEERFIELLEKTPWVNRVISIAPRPKHRLLYDLRFIRELRRESYDAVIDLHNGPRSALLTRFSGSPLRVGWGFGRRQGAYSLHVPSPGEDLHTIENRLYFSQRIGGSKTGSRRRIHVPRESYRLWAERFAEWDIQPHHSLVVLHPGASRADKRWPAERFAAVLTRLLKNPRRRAVITCGPGEEEIAREIAGRVPSAQYAPPSRIADLAGVLDLASLFLGVDSGPMHLAAAMDTPSAALFGATDPLFHGPYGETCRVIQPDSKNLNDITTEEVLRSAEDLLDIIESSPLVGGLNG